MRPRSNNLGVSIVPVHLRFRPKKILIRLIFFVFLQLNFIGCRHYTIHHAPAPLASRSVAIGDVENLTNEPLLAVYVKNKLVEQLVLDGTLTIARPAHADFLLKTRILSYDLKSIGEVKIDSAEDDQRKFRSTIFEVTINLEYQFESTTPSRSISYHPKKISGSAEFTELVDMDIVRRDGFKKAAYDACGKVVSSITDVW